MGIERIMGIERDEYALIRREKMKIRTNFTSIFAAACMLVFLSLPAFSRPSQPPQDQQTS
jgi:hypothetical protein